jgi:hypothetical protein
VRADRFDASSSKIGAAIVAVESALMHLPNHSSYSRSTHGFGDVVVVVVAAAKELVHLPNHSSSSSSSNRSSRRSVDASVVAEAQEKNQPLQLQ